MLLKQKILMHWMPTNKDWYISKGYTFTKFRQPFYVDIKDLCPDSHAKVKVQCDYCPKIFEQVYQSYNRNKDIVNKDCCKDCLPEKRKEVCLKKYNATSTLWVPEFREKTQKTFDKKYNGHPSKCKEVIDKIVGNRYKNSTLEEQTEKRKATNNKKYGYDFAQQNPEIKKKAIASRKEYNKTHDNHQQVVNSAISRSKTAELSDIELQFFDILKNYFDIIIKFPIDAYITSFIINQTAIFIDTRGTIMNLKFNNLSKDEFIKKKQMMDKIISKDWKILHIYTRNRYIYIDDNLVQPIIKYIENAQIGNIGYFDYDSGIFTTMYADSFLSMR